MKKINLIAILSILAVLVSCSEEVVPEKDIPHEGIKVSMPQFEIVEENDIPDTRTVISWPIDATKLSFQWSKGDGIWVFSKNSQTKTQMYYELYNGDGSGQAYFKADGFDLTEKGIYYALLSNHNEMSDDKTSIQISYEGQRQLENEGTGHLSAYYYAASITEVNEEGYGEFTLKQLGCPLRFTIADVAGIKFNKFELKTSDNHDFMYDRLLDITNGNNQIDDYKPALEPGHDPLTVGVNSFSLALGEPGDGITAPTEDGKYLVITMMVPATDEIKGKTLYGELTATTGDKYFFSITAPEFLSGKAYSYRKRAVNSEHLNIALTINKKWQLGNTIEQTRVAGDPGNEEFLDEPDHIYIYTCKDGKFYDLKELDTSMTSDADANNNWAGWSDKGDKWTYNRNITIDIGTAAKNNYHTYIIASKGAISCEKSGGGDLGLSQNVTLEGVVSDMVLSTTFTEEMLRDLYAYDYLIAHDAEPIINAVLYHSCAKLDVQWNNTGAALSGKVSVNNLPTSGIPMFNPVATPSGTGWTIERDITIGTQWNGREYFYVPQLATSTYNVTTGTGKTDNLIFTPSVANKYTSWLKANITIAP